MLLTFSLALLALPFLALASHPAFQGAASRSLSLRRFSPPHPRLLQTRQVFSCDTSCSSSSACAPSCSSPADAAAINATAACSSSDIACVCTNADVLSYACLSCVLQSTDVSASEWDTTCAPYVGTGASASTGAGAAQSQTQQQSSSTGPGVPKGPTNAPTGTGAAQSTTTATSGASCGTQCEDAADQTGLQAVVACGSGDTACVCAASAQLSPACLNCTLSNADVSSASWSADCAAVSNSLTATITKATASACAATGLATAAPAKRGEGVEGVDCGPLSSSQVFTQGAGVTGSSSGTGTQLSQPAGTTKASSAAGRGQQVGAVGGTVVLVLGATVVLAVLA